MSGHLYHNGKIAIIMAGLPGRGKTNRSERIAKYMNWLGVRTRVFHLADYRRALMDLTFQLSIEYHHNLNGWRERVKSACFSDIFDFYKDGGQVAVYDAMNANVKERKDVLSRFATQNVECLFVECLITDEHVLARNIAEVRVTSPDYMSMDPKLSIEHYVKYIEQLVPHYEPLKEPNVICIKLVNDGEQCVVNNGPLSYLLNRVLMFLLNSRRRSGSLFFARAGAARMDENNYNGDNDLSLRGQMYAATMASTLLGYVTSKQVDKMEFKLDLATIKRVADQKSQVFSSHPSCLPSTVPSRAPSRGHSRAGSIDPGSTHSISDSRQASQRGSVVSSFSEQPLIVWTSTRRRSRQTSRPFRDACVPVVPKSLLGQLNAGDAWPYINDLEKMKRVMPQEYEMYVRDQYHFRFPRGESYQDVAVRLEPLMMELERTQTNLLVICQESVMKVLYGYVMGLSAEEIPHLSFPSNQIVEIVPHGYSNLVVHIPLTGVALDGGVDLPHDINDDA